MDGLDDLNLRQIKRIARELKIKGRSKMSKNDLFNEFKKYKDEEIVNLIEKVKNTCPYICIHGKHKYFCKECGGRQLCSHDGIKYRCKECGGSQICIHGRIKYRCKECGGSQICKHNKQKQQCKECGGSQICKHGKQKASCKKCRMELKLSYDLMLK